MVEDIKYIDAVEVIKGGNNNAAFNADKALIMQMMEWAWQHPRNIKKVLNNCTTIITMNDEVAKSCTYNLPKGDGIIGPSVHLARIIAKQMGNMRCESRVLNVEERQVVSEALCFDLETNFAVKAEVRRSIWGIKGRYKDDMIITTGAAASAVAFRNAVFGVIDAEIVNNLHSIAKRKVTGDLSTEEKLVSRRTQIVNGFKAIYQPFGLTENEIAASVKKKLIVHIGEDEVLKLIGYENSLKKGLATFEEIFRPTPDKPTPPPDKSLERVETLMNAAKTRKDLEKFKAQVSTPELSILYDELWTKLK